MPIANLESIEYKLRKRGFKQDDVYYHECPSCHEKAVRVYAIGSKLGGRDIRICLECGKSTSFRAGAGMDGRVQDTAFDLDEFLK